ncbi:alpha/beta fold hydrolase [Plastoroseomonas arctica]|uniref:Alpha/beta hydrolase n=1 Tax=Plastoroseomonas arctica TaxID=1509237 RepID=A0AAF1JXP4_9PROT|nr:alpha/beta hydrolase [Plastoroseomonas arctica]MBR0656299.1 alpha/beta hydrolase [Plastoroseomonas arctica]
MLRSTFENGDLVLSYLDFEGEGRPVVALHAYWMEASTWAELAEALGPEYRLVALDQRGHGRSSKPDDLSWEGYIDDLGKFLDHLGIDEPVVLIGNSLGGTVAFRFAARFPEHVAAMVIEESPAVYTGALDFMRPWSGEFSNRADLEAAVGERLLWSVEPSIRRTEEGWTLVFSPEKLADAKLGLNGDYWEDWLATTHPVLLIRGSESQAVDGAHLAEMAARRPNTRLETFQAGHVIHHDLPDEFAAAVRSFLASAAPPEPESQK